MPIYCKNEIISISQSDFHEIDYRIMRIAFDIHNEFGRLWNERIYTQEMVHRCQKDGFNAQMQIPIIVEHNDFQKRCYIDLLINNNIPYEIKAVQKLDSTHKRQLIKYLMLVNINHGKLINFRSSSVEYQFVSTHLTKEKRAKFGIDDSSWFPSYHESKKFKNLYCILTLNLQIFLIRFLAS